MESTIRVTNELPDLRSRYDNLSTPAARQLVDFLSHFDHQHELRCQRIALGDQYLDSSWSEILGELKTLELIEQDGTILDLDPETRRIVEKWVPGHKRDEAIHQWAQTLASIYFDAELLLRTWRELGQAQVLADINFILELMASFSYGYALNAPGLRQFRHDVIHLRQLMLERVAVWFEQDRSEALMLQSLQFWAARFGITDLADSATSALVMVQQLALALRWHKQVDAVSQLILNKSGQLLAIADHDGTIQVFDLRDNRLLLHTMSPVEAVNTMAFSGSDLFVLSSDNKLSQYSIDSRERQPAQNAPLDVVVARQRQQLVVHSLYSKAAAKLRLDNQILNLSSVGNIVAAADSEGNLFVWEIVGPAGPTTP